MATEESRDTTSKALSKPSTNTKEVKLGRYRVVKRLGKGGMGEVYLGHDDSLNRDVALKVMSRKLTDDPNFVARFKREAQAAASVSHANLVQIHELNETKGFHFFAMEYVEGDTIEELLEKEGYLPTAKALGYMEQAAKGLRAAAKKELIHRDIKPSNIMVNGDGLVKVTDFGLAKALQDGSNLTKTDVILGTPHYVSPEQARGERTVDFRSDMYSLGVTLFEALTGQLPFDATTPMGVMLRHVNDAPPDIKEFRPSLNEEVVKLVNKLLSKSPADRYANYDELIEALSRARNKVIAAGEAADEPPLATEGKIHDEISSAETAASSPAIPSGSGVAETVVSGTVDKVQENATKAATVVEKKEESAPALAGDNTTQIPAVQMAIPPFEKMRWAFWAMLRHPTESLQKLRQTKSLDWWPAIKYGGILWLMFSVGTNIWLQVPTAGHGLRTFLNLELIFLMPFLAFWTSGEHPHGRWKAAFYTIVLGWPTTVTIAMPPLGLLILLYPIYMFKAMTHYLEIKGKRRYLFAFGFLIFLIMRFMAGVAAAGG